MNPRSSVESEQLPSEQRVAGSSPAEGARRGDVSIGLYLHPIKKYIVLPRDWNIACWNPLPGGGVEHIDSWPSAGIPEKYRSPYVCDPKDRPVDSWDYLPEFFEAFRIISIVS